MAEIKYRISSTETVPSSTTVKNSPLTNLEIDANFRSIQVDLSDIKSNGPTGGGSDRVFFLNDNVVTTDYTIPVGKNAGSFGPITVNSGVTVTVPSGSNWVIV
jgi:hypothetical protein